MSNFNDGVTSRLLELLEEGSTSECTVCGTLTTGVCPHFLEAIAYLLRVFQGFTPPAAQE